MAIIPSTQKVFMVDQRTNTTYGGSAALQAMQKWYTMQDISNSVVVPTPTLQQVLTAGTNASLPMTLNTNTAIPAATFINGGANGRGISVGSDYAEAIYAESTLDTAVYGVSGGFLPGVVGVSENAAGGQFSTVSGDYALVSEQEAAKPGGGSWAAYSDSRVKEDVIPYTRGLTEILLVNPVKYKYNGLANTIKGKEYTGVIAQEIKDIFPETVGTYKAKLNKEDEEVTELYDFNSTALVFALINAVKELKAEIDMLKAI